MELVPIRCQDNNSKKFDDKVWWEDLKTIIEVNGEAVNETLQRSALNNGDKGVSEVWWQNQKRCLKEW